MSKQSRMRLSFETRLIWVREIPVRHRPRSKKRLQTAGFWAGGGGHSSSGPHSKYRHRFDCQIRVRFFSSSMFTLITAQIEEPLKSPIF
ncbi:hypothetical protein J6590_043088 [Homalodisca vitripennis]|nr:hypothetical protein J6590_043088 [Homalodisca vitripennis]